MTTPDIETLFRQWWALSYATPPGVHACNTHVGFGTWLLEQASTAPDRSQSEQEPGC
ncbi:MAG: hypothetical protein ACK5JJ_03465 [Cyanobacteriota bacterium]|jgi:hypothetical protein